MSRRRAIGRVSKGVVAAGVAAWIAPEIILATPTTAGAMSDPPSSGSGAASQRPADGGSGASPQGSEGGGPSSAGTTDPAGGALGGQPPDLADAATTSGDTGGASAGTLPFTGFDALRDAGVGGALVAGGWMIKRLSNAKTKPESAVPTGDMQDPPPYEPAR